MNKFPNKVIDFFRKNLAITKQEVIFVGFLFFALVVASLNKFINQNPAHEGTRKYLQYLIDSLEDEETKTFVGTDINSNPVDTANLTNIIKTTTFSKLKDSDTLKKININTASRVELMRLPGIGEKTAQKIIELRMKKKFIKKDDLLEIDGIGRKKLERIEKFITY
ncbi:MAG: helix-hairpin-helix domain-containing protein [Ignavibacteria bacterium]|nr:helix-hairpin-helix domain-containing protein [Ignavibacteria bacterium]